MLYINPNYNYSFDTPSNQYPKKIIQDYLSNQNITEENVLFHFLNQNIYLRFYASLFSVRLKNKEARNKIIDGYKKFCKILPAGEFSKYEYGVDEFALIYIFPYDILLNSNTYMLNMVPFKKNKKNLTEYLNHIYTTIFNKGSIKEMDTMIHRFSRSAILPLIGLKINTQNQLLECEYLDQSQIMASMDEIKPILFATYYKSDNKFIKYNYKDLDISNFRQSYKNNYNWLSMGADIYIKNFDWKHNYDKENNNKYGKILPNNELNWFISKKTYKPYEMELIKLYFIDLTENINSKIIANDIFHCIKSNIIKKPLIVSVANFALDTRKSKTTKNSSKSHSYSCKIKKINSQNIYQNIFTKKK